MRAVVCLIVLSAGPALADDDRGGPPPPVAPDPPYRLNLRIGGASTDRNGMPTVCGEVRVWGGLGVESCGTGAQAWHDRGGTEMMHVRSTFEVARVAAGGGRLGLRAGVGFAELSVAPDQLGFQFGDPDATGASAAGPEASISAQWTRALAGEVEALATFTIGGAYLDGAPQLVLPRERLQPFASLEVGVGW
ncbi:MAG: hypothetical protein IPL61_02100 [Myxococcales bacterium]|nr:hypothetical protein [Myxococcales bacterium]